MKPARCPTCKRLHRRSPQANSRYWLLLHRIAEGIRPQGQVYSADTWHTYFKSRFIGADDVRLPNGKTITVPRSSADLDTGEFNDYQGQVEAWANERGVWLEDEVWAA